MTKHHRTYNFFILVCWLLALALPVHASEKVVVELFYMPQCPGCQQMISGSFSEAFSMNGFHEMAQVVFTPFGDGHRDEKRVENKKKYHRVFDNVLESCALDIIGHDDQHRQLDYIECIDHTETFTTDPSSIDKSCARVVGLDDKQVKAIEECSTSQWGIDLAERNLVHSRRNNVEYTPWVIVNGETNHDIEISVWKSLFLHVCSLYTGPDKSPECPNNVPPIYGYPIEQTFGEM